MHSIIKALLVLILAFGIGSPAFAAPSKKEGFRGTDQVYYSSVPDQIVSTGSITTATTTQLIAPVANQSIFLFWMGVESSIASASNSGTVNLEYSPVAGCASNATSFFPQAVTLPASVSVGSVNTIFSAVGTQGTNGSGFISTGNMPFVVQPGNYVCVVSTGTTIGYYGIAAYAQHV